MSETAHEEFARSQLDTQFFEPPFAEGESEELPGTAQVCWSEKTSGETHVTFSGNTTACGLPVIEAKPSYESWVKDVTHDECRRIWG